MAMSTMQKRVLLFWIGCMGSRSLATWLAYSQPHLLHTMGLGAAAISVGFLTIYFGHLRSTGAEVFGERIWWDSLRPVHALLYGMFAYLALHDDPRAWMLLAADVVLGALAWIFNFYMSC